MNDELIMNNNSYYIFNNINERARNIILDNRYLNLNQLYNLLSYDVKSIFKDKKFDKYYCKNMIDNIDIDNYSEIYHILSLFKKIIEYDDSLLSIFDYLLDRLVKNRNSILYIELSKNSFNKNLDFFLSKYADKIDIDILHKNLFEDQENILLKIDNSVNYIYDNLNVYSTINRYFNTIYENIEKYEDKFNFIKCYGSFNIYSILADMIKDINNNIDNQITPLFIYEIYKHKDTSNIYDIFNLDIIKGNSYFIYTQLIELYVLNSKIVNSELKDVLINRQPLDANFYKNVKNMLTTISDKCKFEWMKKIKNRDYTVNNLNDYIMYLNNRDIIIDKIIEDKFIDNIKIEK